MADLEDREWLPSVCVGERIHQTDRCVEQWQQSEHDEFSVVYVGPIIGTPTMHHDNNGRPF